MTGFASSISPSARPPWATSAIRRPGRVVESDQRNAEDRAGRGANRARRGRIAARGRQRNGRTEGSGGADKGTDVSRIGHLPQRNPKQQRVTRRSREVGPAVDRRRPVVGEEAPRRTRAALPSRSGRRRAARPARCRPPRAASTMSSPSATNRPSLSRQRRSASLRTSLSFSLSHDVITTGAASCTGRSGAPRACPPARRVGRPPSD